MSARPPRDGSSGTDGLFAELKRRRVFRVAAVYAVVAWIIIEVASVVLPALTLPEWTITLVVVLAILGFPVALVFGWAYDITPAGVQRTTAPGHAATGAGGGARTGASATRATPGADGSSAVPPASAGIGGRSARAATAGRIAVVGAVLVLALAGGAFLLFRSPADDLVAERIVIDPFENNTGDETLDAIGVMAADWLVRALQATGEFEVVPLAAGASESGGGGAGRPADRRDRARLNALGAAARLAVSGAYYLEADSLRVIAEVTDARTGRLLDTTDPVSAPRDAPSSALEQLADQVAGFLGMAGLTARLGGDPAQAAMLSGSYDVEAYREYAAGTERFAARDYAGAIPHLERAVERDSTFATAMFRIAVAYRNMGRYAEAEPWVERVRALRDRFTPFERAALGWLEAQGQGDRTTAFQHSRRMAELAPADPWHYLAGLHASNIGRPHQAIELLLRVDPDGDLARAWRPQWNVLANAYHLAGEYGSEIETIDRGRQIHSEPSWYLDNLIGALAGSGRIDDLQTLFDEAEAAEVPTTLRAASRELRAHGHHEAALEAANRALAIERRLAGDELSPGVAYSLYLAEQWDDAAAAFEELLADDPENIPYLARAGVLAARRGDREAALAIDARLAAIDRPYTFGQESLARSWIAAALGDTDNAIRLLRRAIADGVAVGIGLHRQALDFEPIRDDPRFQALVQPDER